MKKKMFLLVILMISLFVTGCDKKQTLTCTKSEDTTGMNVKTTTTTNFVNDSIQTIQMKIDMKLDSSYEAYRDNIKKGLEDQYKSYKDEDGVTYQVTAEEDFIHFTLTIDNKKISDSTRESLKLSGSEKYQTNKETLEKEGYTCK